MTPQKSWLKILLSFTIYVGLMIPAMVYDWHTAQGKHKRSIIINYFQNVSLSDSSHTSSLYNRHSLMP